VALATGWEDKMRKTIPHLAQPEQTKAISDKEEASLEEIASFDVPHSKKKIDDSPRPVEVFGRPDKNRPSAHYRRAWLRLTIIFASLVFFISIVFSALLYKTAIDDIERSVNYQQQLLLSPRRRQLQELLSGRELEAIRATFKKEARQRLIVRLILLNITVLGIGGLLSSILAKRSLEPLATLHNEQERFISDAAHELKTPLTILRLENELFLKQLSAGTTECVDEPIHRKATSKKRNTSTEKQSMQLAKSNIEEIIRLQNLTETLLALSATSDTGEKTIVNMNTTIQRCIRHFESFFNKKFLKVTTIIPEEMTPVFSQEAIIERVLTILLDNAIKYSNENGVITVTVQQTSTVTKISVADTGPGIEESALPFIFDRFFRSDKARSTEGYGLGLSLARQLVQQQGSSLSVVSSAGEGSTFTYTLR
jgi:signal transduction histidine kinase